MSEIVSVLESQISINGEHIIVALGKSAGKFAVGAILSSDDGKQWRVVDSQLKFQKSLIKLIKEKEAEGIFFYDLQGIGHMHRPKVGEELTITQNVC